MFGAKAFCGCFSWAVRLCGTRTVLLSINRFSVVFSSGGGIHTPQKPLCRHRPASTASRPTSVLMVHKLGISRQLFLLCVSPHNLFGVVSLALSCSLSFAVALYLFARSFLLYSVRARLFTCCERAFILQSINFK